MLSQKTKVKQKIFIFLPIKVVPPSLLIPTPQPPTPVCKSVCSSTQTSFLECSPPCVLRQGLSLAYTETYTQFRLAEHRAPGVTHLYLPRADVTKAGDSTLTHVQSGYYLWRVTSAWSWDFCSQECWSLAQNLQV